MTVAYSYIRFSTGGQGKDGKDSLRRQEQLRNDWLARNGATLDTSLVLTDKGVSGFSGAHRSNPDRHALAAFLDLVERGRIAAGSYLLVENLDRLSREDIVPALTLLLRLVEAGVRVVQLSPVESVFDSSIDPTRLMMAIMELSRGHSESKMKSERLKAVWAKKKGEAASRKACHGRNCPTWLAVRDGEYVKDEVACLTVQRIFQMSIDGYGISTICRTLNKERVPTFGRKSHWVAGSVGKILASRATFGEYQPGRGTGSSSRANRKPDGAPIPGYYPAAIDEATFYAARAAIEGRIGKAGREAVDSVNPFQGLLKCALTGSSIFLFTKGKRYLAAAEAVYGVNSSKPILFPYDVFEECAFTALAEINPHELISNGEGKKVAELSGRLSAVETRVAKLKALLRTSDDLESVVETIRELTEEGKVLAAALTEAQKKAASPLSEAWGEAQSLASLVATGGNEVRVKLRGLLRRIIDTAYCVFVRFDRARCALFVRFYFAGSGGKFRNLFIAYVSGNWARKADHYPITNVDVSSDYDLRKPSDALRVKECLDACLSDRRWWVSKV